MLGQPNVRLAVDYPFFALWHAVDSILVGNQERGALRSLGLGYAVLAGAALLLYISVDTD